MVPDEKRTKIEQVIAEVIAQHGSDEHLDSAAIVAEHPTLMPELAKQLETLRAIHMAKRQARCSSAEADIHGTPVNEDLSDLREAFPAFEIFEEIHYGGQGIVYRAIQRATKRVVALKVLLAGPRATERQRRRFEREAELISRLEHPNIVTLYESGLAQGRLYYAMQYVDGVPIDDYLLMKDLTVRQIIELFIIVCRAVAYAHQNGVIHRDLHTANILVDSAGEAHLLDFGLAKDVYSDSDPRISAPGQVVGALPYLSPEQVGANDGRIDVRSDVYSLGVVLYVLLTETFPYRVHGEYGLVREEIVSRPPVPLRKALIDGDPERRAKAGDISADLEAILQMALAKEKRIRYQSASAFADDLEQFLSGGVVAARAANRMYVLRKTLRRYRIPVAVVALIMAVLAVSTVVTTQALHNSRVATALAYDQFDTTLTTVEEAIHPLPGGVAVRDELLRQVSQSLPELAARAASDPALREITTKLAERQGDIAEAQGRKEEALNQYQRCHAAYLHDWETDPANNEELTAHVIRVYRKLAAVSPNPVEVYERALEFVEQAGDVWDTAGVVALELCELRLKFGQYWKARDEYEAALPHLEAALVLYEAAPDDRGPTGTWTRLAASALSSRGHIRLAHGEVETGVNDLRRSCRMREQQLAEHPSDTVVRQHLASIYTRLADVEKDAGNLEEATVLLEKAAALKTLLHRFDPSVVDWAYELFGIHIRLVQLYLTLERPDEASAQHSIAAEIVERLHALAPSNARVLSYRLSCQRVMERSSYRTNRISRLWKPFRTRLTRGHNS